MLDFLIVGSGIYGSVLARELTDAGKKVRVLEKRNHIGGNCYTENVNGIHVHKYGPHYFHTNKKNVWNYVNRFADFTNYSPRVKVLHQSKLYSFPINLFTLHQLFGVTTPNEAKSVLESKQVPIENPQSLEEFVVSKVGWELYHIFYEGYSTKQWGCHPSKIPASVGRRIPIRYTMDDSYHSDTKYQGIPSDGYTAMFEEMLEDIDVELNVDFLQIKDQWRKEAKQLIYSGCIDSFYDCRFGKLDYRSLRHETQYHENLDFQGAAQINYADAKFAFTRVIEHKHFQHNAANLEHTVVTHEYPAEFDGTNEPFYPIGDDLNQGKYQQYKALLTEEPDVTIGGRLGSYKYTDMDDVVQMALMQSQKLLHS
jgi:UDP-galactopyranose mutase